MIEEEIETATEIGSAIVVTTKRGIMVVTETVIMDEIARSTVITEIETVTEIVIGPRTEIVTETERRKIVPTHVLDRTRRIRTANESVQTIQRACREIQKSEEQ